MSLPHVILTVLSNRDATGYDITKEFSHSIGFFWKAGHQQVYRELRRMAMNKQVVCKLEPQEGKPDRKVYSITDLGRKVLLEWFQEPASNPIIRDELCVKLNVCGVYESEPMYQHLEALIEESYTQLNYYKALEQSLLDHHRGIDREKWLECLMLRRVIYNHRAWIRWAEEVLIELKGIDGVYTIQTA